MDKPTLIDVAATWRSLTPEMRDHIGIAAVTHALGYLGSVARPGTAGPEIAMLEATARLGAQLRLFRPDIAETSGFLPNLGAIGVRQCHSCGCTDQLGCPGRCSWIGPNLCSHCRGRAVAQNPFAAEPAQAGGVR